MLLAADMLLWQIAMRKFDEPGWTAKNHKHLKGSMQAEA